MTTLPGQNHKGRTGLTLIEIMFSMVLFLMLVSMMIPAATYLSHSGEVMVSNVSHHGESRRFLERLGLDFRVTTDLSVSQPGGTESDTVLTLTTMDASGSSHTVVYQYHHELSGHPVCRQWCAGSVTRQHRDDLFQILRWKRGADDRGEQHQNGGGLFGILRHHFGLRSDSEHELRPVCASQSCCKLTPGEPEASRAFPSTGVAPLNESCQDVVYCFLTCDSLNYEH